MAALNIEKQLRDAMISIIENVTYITDNEIQVIAAYDSSKEFSDLESKNGKMNYITVNASPVINEIPKSPLFMCPVELSAVTFTEDDKNQAILERLYQELLGVAYDSTLPASINEELTGISLRGIIIGEGQQLFDEEGRLQVKTVNIENYIQAT